MKKRQKIAALLFVIFGLFFYFMVRGDTLRDEASSLLVSFGFTAPQVSARTYDRDNIIFSDIALDKDGFSTIGAVRLPGGLKTVFFHQMPESIIIDDVKLTGSYDKQNGLLVSGWKKKPFSFSSSIKNATLNSGQIDLDTPAGGLRFQAKGNATLQDNGQIAWRALIWGIQNQVDVKTSWEGTLDQNGDWMADIELTDGTLRLEHIQASRMSGWFHIEKAHKAPLPSVSGQIDAGKFAHGAISFMNFRLTMDGPLTQGSIIAQGQIAGYESMSATLDLHKNQVNATIQTKSLDDLVRFLTALRASDFGSGKLTPLLLTQGNIERLYSTIDQTDYDSLELQIYGPIYDLAGKIIALQFRDGISQQRVISLDPGGLDNKG